MKSAPKSSPTSESYFTYETIELKLYMEIASTGEYERLQVSGEKDPGQCIERWEQIVMANSKVSGNGEYRAFVDLQKSFEQLRAQHIIVSALLIKFIYGGKDHKKEVYDELRKRGYRLNINKDRNALDESVSTAIKQCQHLLTKAKSKKNEIDRGYNKKKNERQQDPKSFISVITELRYAVAPTIIPDNIKLAEYNEYFRILKQQAQLKKRNGRVRA